MKVQITEEDFKTFVESQTANAVIELKVKSSEELKQSSQDFWWGVFCGCILAMILVAFWNT